MAEHDPPRNRRGLAVRLAIWLAAVSSAVLFALGYLVLYVQKQHFEEQVLQNAEGVGELVWHGARYHMLHKDREALAQLIESVAGGPGVERVTVREAPSSPEEMTEAVWASIVAGADGRRHVDVRRPVMNHPDCYTASCHFHKPQDRVLGMIDARLSLEEVDAQYAELRGEVIWLGLCAALLLCATGWVFVWRFVHKPVGELAAGMRKVAAGELEHRIEAGYPDEIGELASSFNQMTNDLAAAREEAAEWAGSLEKRVAEKSTELEKMHASLMDSEKMAALGKMAAMVAHEVNSPLFAMLTYARLAQKELDESELPGDRREALRRHLELIERESKRCGTITQDLLELARRGSARGQPVQPNSLNELVRRSLRVVRHRLEEQSVVLQTEFQEPLPSVVCNSGEIQQVLLALLGNAGDAMPSGGDLFLGTAHDPDRETCSVWVRDTGRGIKSKDLPQIFEAFYTTKEDRHRTGLGLPIAKSIVERHGGSIQVESAEGEGAQFLVTLPAPVNGKPLEGYRANEG